MDAGLLPVKRLNEAKGRLAPHLDAAERRRLAEALLQDALSLCESVEFLHWWVVSDDPYVLQEAEARGLTAFEDPGEGLNAALSAALAAVAGAGAESATVIPADAPLAFRGDLLDLLDTGATSEIVLVPSERDGGTNALYMSPPTLLQPNFGEGSLRLHLAQAERGARRCALLSLPRLALDIDTIEDVRDFLARPKQAPTKTSLVLEDLQSRLVD